MFKVAGVNCLLSPGSRSPIITPPPELIHATSLIGVSPSFVTVPTDVASRVDQVTDSAGSWSTTAVARTPSKPKTPTDSPRRRAGSPSSTTTPDAAGSNDGSCEAPTRPMSASASTRTS